MLRLVYRYCLILMLFFMLLILLVMWSGQFRTQAIVLYSDLRMGGFGLWDIQSQRAYYLATADDLGGNPVTAPAWSPDGSEIAFILRENKQIEGSLTISDNLYLMDAFGRDIHLLLDTHSSATISGMNANPQIIWSPDGQLLAFYQNIFSAPRLWIISRDGQVIADISSNFPEDESSNDLPAEATVFWASDNILYVVSSRDDLQYQTLIPEHGAELSTSQTISLPNEVGSIDMLVASPVRAELLLYDGTEGIIYWLDIANQTVNPVEASRDSDLTALAWSGDGQRIAWIERESRETHIYTLSRNNEVVSYQLPARIASDLSFNLWLSDSSSGVIVRMQRGAYCHNSGTKMICADPDFSFVTWFGVP